MTTIAASDLPVVPRAEALRRIAEYRRLAFKHQSAPVIVYAPAQHPCPWPDCDTVIAAIDFQIDQMNSAGRRENWLDAWWQGAGLVGLCPGCKRPVLFGYEGKHAVDNPADYQNALLPENWVDVAQIAPRRLPADADPVRR